MIRPSKKWLAYFAIAGVCFSALGTYDIKADSIYSDENVSISSAVDRYIASNLAAEATEEVTTEVATTEEAVEVAELEQVDFSQALGTSLLSMPAPVVEEAPETVDCQYPEYANKAVITINNYVNIREEGNTNCNVLGSAAPGEIVEVVEKGAEWSLIKVYGIEGYIKNEFLAFGDEAAEFVENDYERIAVINSGSLRLREGESLDSKCLAYLSAGASYVVISEGTEWTKIQVNSNLSGYVKNDYITITNGTPNNFAAIIAQEETTTEAPSTSAPTTEAPATDVPAGSSGITGCTGQDVANFAVQFEGNPYVYGGTSLTNGADCSGFVQSVYANFGIYISRTAGSQSNEGIAVDEANIQPGDLVFYDHNTGSVEHVGIYIGNGQIIHASTSRTGIIIADMHYSNVFKIRRLIY
ncbi:MAG: C40 family peptidase [Lachnospiraceae bacterium]|nr:C40 family peptidase [Lachnospiraceae bacterium]